MMSGISRSRPNTPSHYLLSLVPHFRLAQELLGPGGQVEFEGEAKHGVHGSQEVQAAFDLRLDLGKDGIKGNMGHLSGPSKKQKKNTTSVSLKMKKKKNIMQISCFFQNTEFNRVSVYLLC